MKPFRSILLSAILIAVLSACGSQAQAAPAPLKFDNPYAPQPGDSNLMAGDIKVDSASVFLADLSRLLVKEIGLPDDMVFYAISELCETALHSNVRYHWLPTHTITFSANQIPSLSEVGPAIADRVMVADFRERYEGDADDKDLDNKQAAEAAGLAWNYDRSCARLTPGRIAELEAAGAPRAIRFRGVPAN